MLLLRNVRLRSLQRRSTNAFSIFTKTVDRLRKINSEIEKEQDTILAEIKQREDDHAALEASKMKNNRLVDKISKFLHD